MRQLAIVSVLAIVFAGRGSAAPATRTWPQAPTAPAAPQQAGVDRLFVAYHTYA